MGGGRKALAPLAGRTLLDHVLERLEPQVGSIFLSVDAKSSALDRFGLVQVPDPRPGSNGPLGGLAASIEHAAREGYRWLQLVPCDAPLLPTNLTARLREHASHNDVTVVVTRYAGRLQPVFSLWHVGIRVENKRAVTEGGQAGFFEFLETHPYRVVDWPGQSADPFLNINDHDALAAAERLVAREQEDAQ